VWTPKRVLLLVGGLLAFLSGYAVYAFFLGGIDGLPPLNPEWYPPEIGGPTIDDPPPESIRDAMIRQAFGADSEELRRPIKLVVRDKGMVLSAGEFSCNEKDGRVKFAPFSAALFPKNKDGGPQEINTVKSDIAFLTLDKPVQSASELANRKVTAIELRGLINPVKLTNNRRTPEKSDDLEVWIRMSPLFYEERRNLIWADGFVKLQDFQSQPKPTEITGKGLELHLTPDSGPNKSKVAAAKGKKNEPISNIELLILRANVRMDLYVDADDGFLGSAEVDGKPAPPLPPPDAEVAKIALKGAPAKKPAEKSHVVITTPGPFTYDLPKELAWFDSLPVGVGGPPPTGPEQVMVSRRHPSEGQTDQLVCDHLKLQFRKKALTPGQKAPPSETNTGNKEIETAVATARPNHQVYLAMDTQNLEAYGSELHYRAADPTSGPQTQLKGSPLRAVKDGHKILARELHLTGADKDGRGKRAYAKGPGKIDLADKAAKSAFPVHILWKDTLVSTEEREGGKVHEMWTLTQDAVYIDDEQKQELRGQTLQVWLEPNDPARGGPKAAGGPKQKLHKVEAFENVFAVSQDAIIKHADHLLIIFRPTVLPGSMLPDLPEPAVPGMNTVTYGPVASTLRLSRLTEPVVLVQAAAGAPARTPAIPIPTPPAPPAPALAAPGPAAPGHPVPTGPAAADNQPRKPVMLDARDVVIYVATMGDKKQLETLDASGKVHVTQEPDKADEKGLDVTGDLLNLKGRPSGDKVLTVYGDSRSLARLEMSDTILIGPKVTIDQEENRAVVEGQGAMSMPSKTSLDSDKPARPGARMIIHWNQHMNFDGTNAFFLGGVIGEQDDSKLQCESMQAIMDRRVVFKESQKKGEGAKVERLFCNAKVYALDEQRDKNGKRETANTLAATQLKVDNADGRTHASGPGRVQHLGYSDADAAPAPVVAATGPGAAPAPPVVKKETEMKLTRIDFRGWMYSNTKTTDKKATFRENVEVFNVPSEIFEVQLDPDKLPKDGFFLKCENLEVYTRQAGQKTHQSMIAKDQVYFRNLEIVGLCDVLRFDESNDTITFEANPGNTVQIVKRNAAGKEVQRVTGEHILYNRKSGAFKVGRPGVIQSSWLEIDPCGARFVNPPGRVERGPRG
jgi:hypothetical protein